MTQIFLFNQNHQIMKPFIKPTLTIFLFFFFSNGYTQFWKTKRVVGNGNLTTETITTSDYDQLKSVGFMDVELVRGTEGKIVVETDENIHELVKINVKNNTLILDTNNVNLKTKKGIHIKVPFEELSSITLVGSGDIYSTHPLETSKFETTLIGSGDIDLKVNSSEINANITGSGDMALTGSTDILHVNIKGSGDFKGEDLQSNRTNVSCMGSGDAVVVAENNLIAKVHGSGDIKYKGEPNQKEIRVFGSGDITNASKQ